MILAAIAFAVLQQPVDEAKTLYEASVRKLAALETISGTIKAGGEVSRFRFSKPNLMELTTSRTRYMGDGAAITTFNIADNQYRQYPGGNSVRSLFSLFPGLHHFFKLESSFEFESAKLATFEGEPVIAADYRFGPPGQPVATTTYISRSTLLPIGVNEVLGNGTRMLYTDIKLNEPMTPESFQFIPPSGSVFVPHRTPPTTSDFEKTLLKVGSKAPDFEIKSPTDETITLASSLKGSKGLLMSFWYYGCGPCRMEVPHLEKMAPGLAKQGLNFLTINHHDSKEAIAKYCEETKLTLPVGMNGARQNDVVRLFGIQAFPTNYLIAPDGTVVARFLGWEEDGIKAALKQMGFTL